MLLLEFRNGRTLSFHLVLGPGPERIRKRVFEVARREKKLFNNTPKSLANKWNSLYRKQILNPQHYEEPNFKAIREKITHLVSKFVGEDLESLAQKVQAAF
jgi:hypothetical protein